MEAKVKVVAYLSFNCVKNAGSKAKADRLSCDYSTFYSVLIDLEYFDAI